MLQLFKKIYKTGLIRDKLQKHHKKDTTDKKISNNNDLKSHAINSETDLQLTIIGNQCQQLIDKYFSGSLAIRHVDAGSCNACELEIHALNNVFYNIERFGIHFVASPRHADMLLVTGPISKHMKSALIDTYNAIPKPKLVLAMGNCCYDGGIFKNSYATCSGIKNILPIDGFVYGCPPQPIELLKSILAVLKHNF